MVLQNFDNLILLVVS